MCVCAYVYCTDHSLSQDTAAGSAAAASSAGAPEAERVAAPLPDLDSALKVRVRVAGRLATRAGGRA